MSEQNQNGFIKFSETEMLLPQEEMLIVQRPRKRLVIGIPLEKSSQERRVPLIPQAVTLLTANGHHVMLQTGAGKEAHYTDNLYSEAGADICRDEREVFTADIIIKVSPPSKNETGYLGSRQTLFSSLNLTTQTQDYFKCLATKKTTCFAYEFVKDSSGGFPLIRSMSELVGTAAVHIAAGYLSDPEYGTGSLLGGFPGITPTEVVILGAGTVAEYASRAALGSGAVVKVFDNSIYRLRRLQNILGVRLYTSVLQPEELKKAIISADIVIGAIHSGEGMTPCIVSEDMVRQMKEGSVIIDVSIDQGGCFATSRITSHKEPVFKKYGITHYCVPNIASKVPKTASAALSNYLTPLLLRAGEGGGIENILRTDYGTRQGVYLYHGTLTKSYIGEYFKLPFQDIELLIAAYR